MSSCEQCHTRPKFVENGTTHPYCGRACANTAKNAQQLKLKDAVCKQCGQRPRYKEPSGKIHPFCGQSCAEAAADRKQDRRKEPKSDGQKHDKDDSHKHDKDDDHKAHHGGYYRKRDTYNTGSGSSNKPVRASPRKSGESSRARG